MIIFYIEDYVYNYIEEYINNMFSYLEINNIDYIIYNNQKINYNKDDIYFFIQKYQNIFNTPYETNNIYIINTEQYTRSNIKSYIENYINNDKFNIIDYSNANLNILNDYNIFYLPYLPDYIENMKLKFLIDNNTKIYDIAFVGCMSYRRNKILNELISKNISINQISKWKQDRDIEISKCKILLNIHYSDEYTIFESIRCDRWIFNGMFTISEPSTTDKLNDLSNIYTIIEYDNLVDEIINILNNYDSYYNDYIIKLNKHFNNRIYIYNNFFYYLNNK